LTQLSSWYLAKTACVFGNGTETPVESEIETSGILQYGTYSSLRTMQPFEGYTFANGTGIIDIPQISHPVKPLFKKF
jgi:hypothetical protein